MFFAFEFILFPKCAFSGAFATLRKATVSFVTPVRLSVRVEQLDPYGADFHEILYSRILKKSVEKIRG
jgi:hypothetical protein